MAQSVSGTISTRTSKVDIHSPLILNFNKECGEFRENVTKSPNNYFRYLYNFFSFILFINVLNVECGAFKFRFSCLSDFITDISVMCFHFFFNFVLYI